MKDRTKYYKEISDYYRKSNILYKYVWYAGKSLGLHFGFADQKTSNHTEALINQYKYVMRKGNIVAGMKVFDAGCGVGGASLYIAKNTGATLVGITLVKEQAEEAKENAKYIGVDSLTTFKRGDYSHTKLTANSFDVVFGIESICYAYPKKDFLKEASRLLKPGGVLIITDGYRKHEVKSREEKLIMRDFCDGWKLAQLVSISEMTKALNENGFKNVCVEDKTEQIKMSLNKMRTIVKLWKVGELLFGWLKLPIIEMARLNEKAMRNWIKGVELGLFGYYAIVAKK